MIKANLALWLALKHSLPVGNASVNLTSPALFKKKSSEVVPKPILVQIIFFFLQGGNQSPLASFAEDKDCCNLN